MVIVTSDAGFIGGNIIEALNDKSITDILMMDNLKDGTKLVGLVDLDIADYMDKEDFLIQIMADEELSGIEAIFHEGACFSTTEWDSKCMMGNNYQYSRELLYYCLEREAPFLYAFSTATHGGCTSGFIESREYEKPLNVYSYSKFPFDKYVRQTLPEASSQIVGLRYLNVYGPREGHKGSMTNVAFHLSTQLNNGESPKLFEGSENFKRNFIYMGGVADVNLRFLEDDVSDIFNLGTGRAESFQTVADATLAYHKKSQIKYTPFPDKLKGHYQTFAQVDLTNLCAAGYGKPFKIVTGGVTEYMARLDRDV